MQKAVGMEQGFRYNLDLINIWVDYNECLKILYEGGMRRIYTGKSRDDLDNLLNLHGRLTTILESAGREYGGVENAIIAADSLDSEEGVELEIMFKQYSLLIPKLFLNVFRWRAEENYDFAMTRQTVDYEIDRISDILGIGPELQTKVSVSAFNQMFEDRNEYFSMHFLKRTDDSQEYLDMIVEDAKGIAKKILPRRGESSQVTRNQLAAKIKVILKEPRGDAVSTASDLVRRMYQRGHIARTGTVVGEAGKTRQYAYVWAGDEG